jgi:hypothetical protein
MERVPGFISHLGSCDSLIRRPEVQVNVALDEGELPYLEADFDCELGKEGEFASFRVVVCARFAFGGLGLKRGNQQIGTLGKSDFTLTILIQSTLGGSLGLGTVEAARGSELRIESFTGSVPSRIDHGGAMFLTMGSLPLGN